MILADRVAAQWSLGVEEVGRRLVRELAASIPRTAATLTFPHQAGNLRCLLKVYRAAERYWRRMLHSRSWAGRRLTWEKYHQIKARMPLLKPKLRLPYAELQALAVL
jgi:hypothetical protein